MNPILSSFDPSLVANDYGPFGPEIARCMVAALDKSGQSLGLKYDPSSKTFTVLNSKDLNFEAIQNIFKGVARYGLKPEVDPTMEGRGNWTVVLSRIAKL